jgi:hypothetical protein
MGIAQPCPAKHSYGSKRDRMIIVLHQVWGLVENTEEQASNERRKRYIPLNGQEYANLFYVLRLRVPDFLVGSRGRIFCRQRE